MADADRCVACGGDGYHGPYCWRPAFERLVEDRTAEMVARFIERCCDPPNAFSKSLVEGIRDGSWRKP